MRALSWRQADRCETAKGGKCRCRCGGKLHGKKRAPEPDRAFFEQLPEDDAHHIRSAAEKKLRAKIRREQAQLRLWEN